MPVNGSENDGLLQLKRRDQSRASHDSVANLTPSPLTSEGRKRGREVKRGCWSAEPNSFEDFLSSRSLFLPRLFFRFSPNELSCRFPVELQRPTPPPPPPGVVFVCGADPSVRPLSLPLRPSPVLRSHHPHLFIHSALPTTGVPAPVQALALAAQRFSPPQHAAFVLVTAAGPISPPDPFSL